jgi:hypothetical protein
MPAELAAFLASQPKWSTVATVEAGFGFKDNLLLSHAEEERSAFARGSAEFMLLRLPRGAVDFSLYGQAERIFFPARRSRTSPRPFC